MWAARVSIEVVVEQWGRLADEGRDGSDIPLLQQGLLEAASRAIGRHESRTLREL